MGEALEGMEKELGAAMAENEALSNELARTQDELVEVKAAAADKSELDAAIADLARERDVRSKIENEFATFSAQSKKQVSDLEHRMDLQGAELTAVKNQLITVEHQFRLESKKLEETARSVAIVTAQRDAAVREAKDLSEEVGDLEDELEECMAELNDPISREDFEEMSKEAKRTTKMLSNAMRLQTRAEIGWKVSQLEAANLAGASTGMDIVAEEITSVPVSPRIRKSGYGNTSRGSSVFHEFENGPSVL